MSLFEAKGPIHETRSLSLSLSLLVLFAAPVEAQAPKRKAAAVDPMRFDLVCRVTTVSKTGVDSQAESMETWAGLQVGATQIYSFDLAQRRYFQKSGGEGISVIQGIYENYIILFDGSEKGRFDANSSTGLLRVNRRTGGMEFKATFHDSGYREVGRIERTSTCTRAPFSGFPSTRF